MRAAKAVPGIGFILYLHLFETMDIGEMSVKCKLPTQCDSGAGLYRRVAGDSIGCYPIGSCSARTGVQ